MPYCENCGTQVNVNAKFCNNCGSAQTQNQSPTTEQAAQKSTPAKHGKPSYYSPPNPSYVPSASYPILSQQPQQQTPQPISVIQQPVAPMHPIPPQTSHLESNETTIGVIQLRHLKSMGRYDSFVGVITSQRMIFARLTAEMMNQAVLQAREQAKAEGKGFFGQWKEQLKGTFGYADRYLTMSPQAILTETAENFAVSNEIISEVKIRLKGQNDNSSREFEVEIKSAMGTYKYRMAERKEYINLLKRIYGERVKMPFGYFGTSVNIRL